MDSKQVAYGAWKQGWALLQCWRGPQNKHNISSWDAPIQITHRPNIQCKIKAYKRILKEVQDGGLKQSWALEQTSRIAQKRTTFSIGRSSKQWENRLKKWGKKMVQKREFEPYPWRPHFCYLLAWGKLLLSLWRTSPCCWKWSGDGGAWWWWRDGTKTWEF